MIEPKGIRSPGNDIYTVDFSEYLPESLKKDPKMKAFAAAVTQQLLSVSGHIKKALIYSRFDELPEDLVDILAYDMHVDWYDYSLPLKTKRELVKNSVKVHKKMGTKYAVETALGGLYPESEVEEWFQYGGKPYHFRVVCDVTENEVQASFQAIVDAVKMYKRLSAHLDDVTFQSRIYCTIQTHTDYYIYHSPYTGRLHAGTYPRRSVRSALADADIIVDTMAAGYTYTSTEAGTLPERNILFRYSETEIETETASNSHKYISPAAGTIPERNILFRASEMQIEAETEGEAIAYESDVTGKEKTGTRPERNILFHVSEMQIEAETEGEAITYESDMTGKEKTGTRPERNIKFQTSESEINAETDSEANGYISPAAGTIPERNILFHASEMQIEAETEGEAITYESDVTGKEKTGTRPERNILFHVSEMQIEAETEGEAIAYESDMTGKEKTGTRPERNIYFRVSEEEVKAETDSEAYEYNSPTAGTLPERNTILSASNAQIDAETGANTFRYRNILTGEKNAGMEPQRSSKGGNEDGEMESTVETESFIHNSKLCGSKRKL